MSYDDNELDTRNILVAQLRFAVGRQLQHSLVTWLYGGVAGGHRGIT
jgi:hypothetical protein